MRETPAASSEAFLEQLRNPEPHVAANVAQELLATDIAPEIAVKDQRAVAEVFKYDADGRTGFDLGLRFNGFEN